MLEGYGHTVHTEPDGELGLERLMRGAGEIDVALVDIQMPGICGDEVIVKYRQWEKEHRPGKRRMRIYACTGNATSTDAAAYMTAGFDGCVSKPIYPQTFKALLSDNKSRVQSALVVGCTHTHSSPSSSGGFSSGGSGSSSPEGGLPMAGLSHGSCGKLSPLAQPSPVLASPIMAYWSGASRERAAREQAAQSKADWPASATLSASAPAMRRTPAEDGTPPAATVVTTVTAAVASKRIGGMSPLVEGSSSNDASSTATPLGTRRLLRQAHAFPETLEVAPSADLPPEVRERAAQQCAKLPLSVVAGIEMTSKLGYSDKQAEALLLRFVPYATQQKVLMAAALEAEQWAPPRNEADRAQKSVRSLAHSCKGAAGMICAHRVVEASRCLQDAAEVCAKADRTAEEELLARASCEVWKLEVDRLLRLIEQRPIADLLVL